jgi:hypothetical protein
LSSALARCDAARQDTGRELEESCVRGPAGSEAANRPAQFSIKEYMSQFILCCKINYKCFFAQSDRLARSQF